MDGGYGNETEKAMGSQMVHEGIFATTKGNGGGGDGRQSTLHHQICTGRRFAKWD